MFLSNVQNVFFLSPRHPQPSRPIQTASPKLRTTSRHDTRMDFLTKPLVAWKPPGICSTKLWIIAWSFGSVAVASLKSRLAKPRCCGSGLVIGAPRNLLVMDFPGDLMAGCWDKSTVFKQTQIEMCIDMTSLWWFLFSWLVGFCSFGFW